MVNDPRNQEIGAMTKLEQAAGQVADALQRANFTVVTEITASGDAFLEVHTAVPILPILCGSI